jgi:hypothetical protein
MEEAQIWRELYDQNKKVQSSGRLDNLAQIWRELAPHFFPADCFGGSSDFAGTGSTLFSGGLFWRQLRFGGNHNNKTDTTAQL